MAPACSGIICVCYGQTKHKIERQDAHRNMTVNQSQHDSQSASRNSVHTESCAGNLEKEWRNKILIAVYG